jgi:hypothetical protein
LESRVRASQVFERSISAILDFFDVDALGRAARRLGFVETHLEATSLAPDGTPCASDTSGLLQRASIVAGAHVPIGKETERRSEHGGDWSLLQVKGTAYRSAGRTIAGDQALRAKMRACGVRALMRKTGLSRHTIEKILAGLPVRAATLQRVVAALV